MLLGKYKNRMLLISVLLFVGCLIIYMLNLRLMISGDSIPTSIWIFNLLENHSITFNNLVNQPLFANGLNYYFVKHTNGDWITIYPIGTAIFTAPLYLLFYLQFKLTHAGAPLNLLVSDFEMQRRTYENLAAAILASGSVVIFFHLAKVRFRSSLALITALIFGFATTTWTVSSQALWQHGTLNFCVLASLLALAKAKPSAKAKDLNWQNLNQTPLILSGIFCGLLLGIRPTAVVYILPALIYVGMTQFRGLIFLGLGLLSCLPALIWNLYYFGNILGGYSSLAGFHQLQFFTDATAGILFSPSRGLFVYSPVLWFVVPGCLYLIRNFRRNQYQPIDGLLFGTFVMSGVILLSYCFVACWWGGYSYGPRFLTDVLPAFCLMLAYCLEWLARTPWKTYWRVIFQAIFATTAVISMGVQFLGVAMPLNAADWNGIPYPVDIKPQRAWQWSDSQILRHLQALRHEPAMEKLHHPDYVAGFQGKITGLKNESGKLIQSAQTLRYQRSKVTNLNYIILRPQLTNLGVQPWYGYRYGIQRGSVYVKGKLLDQQDQLIQETDFYLPKRGNPQQSAEAIGAFVLPRSVPTNQQPNLVKGQQYKLVLSLWIRGATMLPADSYSLNNLQLEVDPSVPLTSAGWRK
jgi:hypothetical protein